MKSFFLILILSFAFCAKTFAADYYFTGVDAFKKGVYDKAASNLEHAVRINSKNVNARYYLAQTYLKQNRIEEAKEQYKRIIFLAPASDAGILSQKGLSYISQAADKKTFSGIASNDSLSAYKDNYLDYVISSDGNLLKWTKFPVAVYIEPNKHKEAVRRAFDEWQKKSNNLVSFSYLSAPTHANITVDFKSQLEESEAEQHYVAGYSKPYFDGEKMTKSEIHLLLFDPATKKEFDDEHFSETALHEIGHSLGFRGHSPEPEDIMAAVNTVEKFQLTKRDINTIHMLYKIDKRTLASRDKGQSDTQLEQALDYVRTVPDKAVGWTNLGDIYRNKKMYSEAIKNYKKAISIEPLKTDAYALIGLTYTEMGDNNNAFNNLKKACDLDKKNAYYLYLFAQNCHKTGKKDIGKAYLDSYIKSNPQSIFDEKIQALMKMYK